LQKVMGLGGFSDFPQNHLSKTTVCDGTKRKASNKHMAGAPLSLGAHATRAASAAEHELPYPHFPHRHVRAVTDAAQTLLTILANRLSIDKFTLYW
jgi:hypothetical protein